MGKVSARLLTVLSALVVVAVSLSGCSTPVKPTTSPVPTSSPVFASDAQALAAAEKAYAAYLKVSDQIAQEGGANPERIADYVTHDELAAQLNGFTAFSKRTIRSLGTSKFDTVSLQQYHENAGAAEIDVYLCSDVSEVRLLDESGNDVTPASRPNRLPLSVEFTKHENDRLLLAKSESWSGKNFC